MDKKYDEDHLIRRLLFACLISVLMPMCVWGLVDRSREYSEGRPGSHVSMIVILCVVLVGLAGLFFYLVRGIRFRKIVFAFVLFYGMLGSVIGVVALVDYNKGPKQKLQRKTSKHTGFALHRNGQ